ncbi:Alpha-ketoglutarate-dependent sulfonate dioxygenase 5 [Colletotrichum truncatum]|uniref:Alpha-ketoglutarate-dependent sulfonate dioxygenase 5 n=1 Tax=Colletotrichum truncatum TaxID=5467 RepID=A0ACC3YQC9_COLTU|nr:Alpha-ketoglutarate-dependent sulfonate dioxygenase 5 [Colletotrichum truncatum]KAF6796676.1 Alpha-ketoglutarate-dependent sulfonate dioxygenase 5 [Colletotrichum truncatum]
MSPATVPERPAVPELPELSRKRLQAAGIDLTQAYPEHPKKVLYLQDVYKLRGEDREYVDPASRADPEKRALFSAAKEVKDVTVHIGTEITGLQLKDLTDQQRDELALLIAERGVVFLRDQDLSPQKQLELGAYFGEVEVNPQDAYVPGLPGTTVVWPAFTQTMPMFNYYFRNPFGTQRWHTDMAYEHQPPGYTHLHNDAVPEVGGDTLWASGYAAYDKLSPAFREMIDGRECVYRSAYKFLDREDPEGGPKLVERTHPMVRLSLSLSATVTDTCGFINQVHPVTGWKSLYVNRAMTLRIVGLDQGESDAILNYLFSVYEGNVDIQCRFRWTPGTSAIWDNRVTMHSAAWDYEGKGKRHGTRVSSLAEKPFFDPKATSRRRALGIAGPKEY